jgi:putative membrane protein
VTNPAPGGFPPGHPASRGPGSGGPGSGGPGSGGPAQQDDGWHRLHPLSPLVRAGRHLVTIVILVFVVFFANHNGSGGDLIGNLAVIAIALGAGVVSWLVTRWQLADGVLRIETGLIRRQSRRFPLSQVQAIDVVQTGVARVLGLAELQLRMAGADSSGGRLASMPLAEAELLRQRLLTMARTASAAARGAASGTAARDAAARDAAADDAGLAAADRPWADHRAGVANAIMDAGPERQLFRVKSSRLGAAIALSRTGAYAAAVITAFALIVAITGSTAFVASFLPIGLGVVVALWRRFNSDYGTVVAAAPDGLRLRSGLVQTTAETIRPGRVQGVRLVEPLLWRPLGWCRLEADVAGPRQRRENRSESQRLRALIPVGSRAEADQMISELLRSQPAPSRRAPAAARWKAPLSYHFLGWGGDDHYVTAARGRVCRTTTWVPLEKVQSIRWVQGPLQRQLGLASVRLDVAGRRVTADIEDRLAAEAREVFGKLPDLAASARKVQPPAPTA